MPQVKRPASLRDMLTANLPLKALALFLALTMWGFVAPKKRGESTEIKFFAPLVVKNIPPNLVVTSELPHSVNVLVRFPLSQADQINPSGFQVVVDLGGQMAGRFNYVLSDTSAQYNNQPVPKGVNVLQVSPAQVRIHLEEMVTKEVALRPVFSGQPAQGFQVENVKMVPSHLMVRGPKAVLDAIGYVKSKPLDIQDLKTSVEMKVVPNLPPNVRAEENPNTIYRAEIQVGILRSRLSLKGVPILFEKGSHVFKASAEKMSVELSGPEEVMGQLNNTNVFGVVDLSPFPPGTHQGVRPKVMVPRNVRVVSQGPELVLTVSKRPLRPVKSDEEKKAK